MNAVHIVVAMKPIEVNYAENALCHGVVGLNIDGCRVGTTKRTPTSVSRKTHGDANRAGEKEGIGGHDPNIGRFPANVIHDGSEEVQDSFPDTGKSTGGGMKRDGSNNAVYGKHCGHQKIKDVGHGDKGSASRFFKECKV